MIPFFVFSQDKAYDNFADEARKKGVPDSDIPGYVKYRMHQSLQQASGNYFRIDNPPPLPQQPCCNVDFEMGNFTCWNGFTGNHPSYGGCCTVPGFVPGRHTIVSGPGLDPCGGFPIVAPGGTFSFQLGNNSAGGEAERITQTFSVTSATTSFIYRYAVVLEDPGHPIAEQPSFEAVMFDQNNNQIPCSYYQVSAGQNIPGFFTSNTCIGVIYKPWTPVYVDLTPYIGQNVTIQFTTYDCGYGGHFGYAYVDGMCTPMSIVQNDTLCSGQTATLTAPAGSATYLWSPGGQTTQTITVSQPGQYCVQLTSITNNNQPQCTLQVCHTVNIYPSPTACFSFPNNNCTMIVPFNDCSTVNGSQIVQWDWDFGDNTTSSQQNPVHTYTAMGTYTVTLTVYTADGCDDDTTITVSVAMLLNANFTANNVCLNELTIFTDSTPNATQWQWDFGDNTTSTLQNPVHLYTSPGTYTVTLIVSAPGFCGDTLVQTVNVYPLPVAAFTYSIQPPYTNIVSFTNQSTGFSAWSWSFGDGTPLETTVQNPVHTYPQQPDVYTVILYVETPYGCRDTIWLQVVIEAPFTFYIPNTFTPNGDGVNDYFFGKGEGISDYEIYIFDRWGNLIFKGDELTARWDGKVQGGNSNEVAQIDTYVWIVRLTDIFNTKHKYTGHVNLIK